ncbi:type II toxin-antitoxin system HigB family toxin [Gelidibacter pelagius]|uniref:type II toxin-antitoxin system HigB family toxin n=1 Tax=Gelidibacter pelagius TaxID=2819985 RepID=UPI00293D8084|nr:type II toxin-antitoxin system HigB family toxin [Gelidibacter pelagius]
MLTDGRVVFNINGNAYLLIAKYNYQKNWAFIRFIGTDGEPARPAGGYDKIDADTILINSYGIKAN